MKSNYEQVREALQGLLTYMHEVEPDPRCDQNCPICIAWNALRDSPPGISEQTRGID